MWRDEAHGRLQRDDDDSNDDDENPQRQADNAEANTPSSPAPRSSPSRPSPRGSSPTSQTDHIPEPRPVSDIDEDEQEAFWKSLDEVAGDSSDAPQAPTTGANSSVDGDDYMWDILDDIETTSTTEHSNLPPDVPPQSTSAVEVTTTANPSTNIADDWDDMYL